MYRGKRIIVELKPGDTVYHAEFKYTPIGARFLRIAKTTRVPTDYPPAADPREVWAEVQAANPHFPVVLGELYLPVAGTNAVLIVNT